jgi:hypothetical protein
MNVGDPNGAVNVQLLPRESEMFVVVKITGKVKPEGAKGHYYKRSFKECKLNRIDSYESGKSWSKRTRRAV